MLGVVVEDEPPGRAAFHKYAQEPHAAPGRLPNSNVAACPVCRAPCSANTAQYRWPSPTRTYLRRHVGGPVDDLSRRPARHACPIVVATV